jgi:hypothetical protein
MLTKRDRTAVYKVLQEVQRNRIANLQTVAENVGGWAALARMIGMNPNLLSMMAGSNPTRTFSEVQARRIEVMAGLAPGWLDQKH